MLWVRVPPELLATARYANWQSGEVQTFVILRVRLPPSLLPGWCSSRLPVKQLSKNSEVADERFNSFTAHAVMARSSNGRMEGSQPFDAGSIPARVTYSAGEPVLIRAS
jgi:hypothetical protein